MAELRHQTYSDNIDTELLIDGNEWLVIEARVELTLGHKADYVKFDIAPTQETQDSLPSDPALPVSEGGLLGTSFSLDVTPQLDIGDRGQNTRLFTGALANLTATGLGNWKGEAFDPSYKVFAEGTNFMNQEIDIPSTIGAEDLTDNSLVEPKFRSFTYGGGAEGVNLGVPDFGSENSFNTPSATRIKASELASLIADEAGISNPNIVFEEGGVDQGNGNRAGYDIDIQVDDESITVDDALTKLETSAEAAWWFNREGEFYIGAPVQGEPVDEYELIFITETSAGASTPAYQSVEVIGSGVVSERGWAQTNLQPEDPITIESSRTSGEREPVFTYRNMSIQTDAEAEQTANAILNDLQDQQKDGKVTVVGMPEVRPRDLIRMPSSEKQPMGGTEYGVTKVVHKLNSSDGFITNIHVGGVRQEQEVLQSEQPDTEYGEWYAYIRTAGAPTGGPQNIRPT